MSTDDAISKLNDLLTLVIPVNNEEKNLPGCLRNVARFRHVVVADSGSDDSSRAIFDSAVAEGGEACRDWSWLVFKWDGRFPKKRNWVLRNFEFKTPFAMFLDADERLSDAWISEAAEALSAAALKSGTDAWICYYDNWFMGRMLRHGDVMRKTAVLRLGAGEYERIEEKHWSSLDMEIHEHLVVAGKVAFIGARLEHHDMRSLESYYAKHESYAAWEAARYARLVAGDGASTHLTRRQRVKYGLVTKWFFAPLYFFASYILKFGFLDGRPGLVFACGKMRYFRSIRRKILEAEGRGPK